MRLCLITNGDCNNPKLWSGTPFRMRKELEALPEIELSLINYQLAGLWRSVCYRIFCKRNSFVKGGCTDPWYHYFLRKRLRNQIRNSTSADIYLFICCGNNPQLPEGQCRYASYTDSIASFFVKKTVPKGWWHKWYADFVIRHEREFVRNATVIFSQNEWVRERLMQEYAIPPERIFNVGFGVNLVPYTGEKDYSKEELLIVLRRGTEHYKGLDLLLDAFELLHRTRPQAHLSVVGTTARPLDGVTYFEGFPRAKTVELFQQTSLYVMPALREPNGITYLEGLANRAPIVGLNRFAVPEFSGYGKWGFMAEHEDPAELAEVLDNALSDKERLRQMGLAGQAFVRDRYDWSKVTRNMTDIMQKAVSENWQPIGTIHTVD